MTEDNEERKLEPFVRRGTEENQVEVSADEVLNAIAEGREIDIEWAVIEGDLDIKKIRDDLAKEDGRSVIRCNVKVQGGTIKGKMDFSFATFGGHADFSAATFSGDAIFRGAMFSGDANFYGTTFNGFANFYGTTFSGDANFFRTTFSGRADFLQATFSGNTDFLQATFGGNADFHGATFSEAACFREATFGGAAYFIQATFGGYTDFIQATFSKGACFQATFSGVANFMQATFGGNADFSGATFKGDANFFVAKFSRSAYFSQAHMERPASFADVQFDENKVFVGLWNDVFRPIFSFILWPVFWLVSHLLKKSIDLPKCSVTDFSRFNTTTIMDGSSNPCLKRYIDDRQWITSWRKRGWVQKSWFFVWELTSHCGRSIGLWAFWSLLLAVAFGAIYADYAVPSWIPDRLQHLLVAIDPDVLISPKSRVPTAFTPFYFSIVTFTTLGFGDVTPLNLAGEIWLALEVVFGYIMLGGLISIFANKLARRA